GYEQCDDQGKWSDADLRSDSVPNRLRREVRIYVRALHSCPNCSGVGISWRTLSTELDHWFERRLHPILLHSRSQRREPQISIVFLRCWTGTSKINVGRPSAARSTPRCNAAAKKTNDETPVRQAELEGAGSRYDSALTSHRESFSSRSRVRFTLNSAPASRRSAWPFARSNTNRTGRRPGELARILRTSRNSSPVVAGENCKSTADSLSVDSSVAPLVFRGESVLISCATARGISSRLSSVPLISMTRPAAKTAEVFR